MNTRNKMCLWKYWFCSSEDTIDPLHPKIVYPWVLQLQIKAFIECIQTFILSLLKILLNNYFHGIYSALSIYVPSRHDLNYARRWTRSLGQFDTIIYEDFVYMQSGFSREILGQLYTQRWISGIFIGAYCGFSQLSWHQQHTSKVHQFSLGPTYSTSGPTPC